VADVVVVQDGDEVVGRVLDAALGARVALGCALFDLVFVRGGALAGEADGLADPVGDGLVVDDERAVVDGFDERHTAEAIGHPGEDLVRDLLDGEGRCGGGCHGVLLGT
jgi:hypothetical protein